MKRILARLVSLRPVTSVMATAHLAVHLAVPLVVVLAGLAVLSPAAAVPVLAQGEQPAPAGLSPRNQVYGQEDALAEPPAPQLLAPSAATPLPDPAVVAPAAPGYAMPESYNDLVVQSYRDRNWELYRVYVANHTNPRTQRLTVHPAYDGEPRLRRGGSQVLFVSNRDGNYELYKMDADGSNLARLTFDPASDRSPAWSPDGSRIAFVSNRTGSSAVYLMNSEGGELQQLSNNHGPEFHPSFSPDGQLVAWIRAIHPEFGTIVLMEPESGDFDTLPVALRFVSNLAWSPNGDSLAFDYDADGDGWNELGVIELASDSVTTLVDGGDRVDILAGSWSWTGAAIYYSEVRYRPYEGTLYVVNTSTKVLNRSTGMTTLISTGNLDLHPDAQATDVTVPVSHVSELPAYSPASEVRLVYATYDPGPALAMGVELQYRYAGGAWTRFEDYYSPGNPGRAMFRGQPGQIVYFRSQATDRAGHVEEWPPGDGDAWTMLYTWQVAGRVSDNRGQSLAGARLAVAPAPLQRVTTGPRGDYTGYLTASGTHTVTARHPGYGKFAASSFEIGADMRYDAYLPDAAGWLANGDFEAQPDPFVGWQRSSSYTPTLYAGYTGLNAVHLGTPCVPSCFAAAQALAEGEEQGVIAAGRARRSELSTTIAIPRGAHRPTLSFFVRSPDLGAEALVVSVSDVQTPTATTVYTGTSAPDWQLGWAALDAWAGRTVTVTFAVTVAAGAPAAHVWLDSIAAGEWWTPVVGEVTPAQLEAGAGGTLTIQGENFTKPSRVLLGDLELSNVRVVSERTIEADVPADAAVGVDYVTVIAAEGQVGASANLVEIGRHLYLPVMKQ